MNILFCVTFSLIFLYIESEYILSILYYLQLNEYRIASLFSDMMRRFKNNILYWFLYIVIFITLGIINFSNIYFLYFSLCLMSLILIFMGEQFKNIFKIKYTKRMTRIIFVILLFVITLLIIILSYMNNLYKFLTLPLILVLNYFLILLVLVILSPIEKLIGKYYINKCKEKLRNHKKLIKIGITGSFGKTSVKEVLTTILSQQYNVLSTPKSYNTPFGITKTVLNHLDNTHEIFVCEMGAKKVGEINELCSIVNADLGIVTSVGRQHTNTFGSIENIYKTKKELPDSLYNKSCVFNVLNPYVRKMSSEYTGKCYSIYLCLKNKKRKTYRYLKSDKKLKCKKINILVYSEFKKENCAYAKNIILDENGIQFDIYFNKEFICIGKCVLLGLHNIINILLAVAMAKILGVSSENISLGISKIKQINARLEKYVTQKGAIVINNGYNSNIDSFKSSLEILNLFDRDFKVVITPGLIDCENDYDYNKKFGQGLSKFATDVIIVKEKNKEAIYAGLISEGFDSKRIYFVKRFSDTKKILDTADENYVFLIENDLPENFR